MTSARVRYDGIQPNLFGDPPLHCYTIVDPSSPAHGASFCMECEQPSESAVAAAALAKEAEFLAVQNNI